MTALPDWMDLPDGLSVAESEALPEEIYRRIEVVDGGHHRERCTASPSSRYRAPPTQHA